VRWRFQVNRFIKTDLISAVSMGPYNNSDEANNFDNFQNIVPLKQIYGYKVSWAI
jgi:hypothetical protein